MPKPRPLTPYEAQHSIAHRFTRIGDRLRQFNTKFGLRPYRVFLVWVKWDGAERGEGNEREIQRTEILPTPLVESLDSVTFSFFHAGTLPVGSIKVSQISAGVFTEDMLRGRMIPVAHEDSVPEPFDFFYEVYEDGRGDPEPVRGRYRLLTTPMRRAGKLDWNLMLERVSPDPNRHGTTRFSPGGLR